MSRCILVVFLIFIASISQAEVNYQFLDAAENGDVGLMKREISSGVDINSASYSGHTALMRASYYGRVNVVTFLLGKGINIEAKNLLGETAIYQAVIGNRGKVAKILAYNGVDVNVSNLYGISALRQAVKNKNLEIIKLLIASGADVVGEDGDKAMVFALSRTSAELVRLLIDKGVNVNSRFGGESYLTLANRSGKKGRTVVVALLESDIEISDEVEKSILRSVARWGNDEVLSSLVDMKVDLNQLVDNRDTSLTLAIRNDDLKAVKMLLRKGVDPDGVDRHGRTPLMIVLAVPFRGHFLDEILNKTKNINYIYNYNNLVLETALGYAVTNYSLDVVDKLVKAGADVNLGGVLTRAILLMDIDKVRYLLDHGVSLEGKKGDNALDQAATYVMSKEIVSLILERDSDKRFLKSGAALEMAKKSHGEILELFIEYGVDRKSVAK